MKKTNSFFKFAVTGTILLSAIFTSCLNPNHSKESTESIYPADIFSIGNAGTCGLQIGDSELMAFTDALSFDKQASDISYNSDGSVTYTTKAAGGAGAGVAFYLNPNHDNSIINTANYDSVDIEIVYSPIEGKWNSNASNPGFALRLLTYDSTGVFGGAVDVEYFETKNAYGTFTYNIKFPEDLAAKVEASADYDGIKAFCLKFNDYQRGNTDGDSLRVQIKKVRFNKKADAAEDKAYDDGLTAEQRGTVKSIYYPTKDYTNLENPSEYSKHAWVYLPAGYDENDHDTKYPVFVLLHGFGQNENTWGLSDKGTGGKIKGYMDRGMASDDVKKFILVVATGVASPNWGPNGPGNDINGFNSFAGELRNDLLPYIWENFNTKKGRENTALAGLSMGGGQTLNIGIGQSLDLISYFGAFSAASFTGSEEYIKTVETNFPDPNLKVQNLYMICGDADGLVFGGFQDYTAAFESWNKLENFSYDVVPGGTHDFPVWYQGFRTFIPMLFK